MSDFNNPIIVIDDEPVQLRGIISPEKPQQCDDCGEIAELRPYGPSGTTVCFDCGMKDPAEAVRQLIKLIVQENIET